MNWTISNGVEYLNNTTIYMYFNRVDELWYVLDGGKIKGRFSNKKEAIKYAELL